jgi:hypothetical protein
MTTDMRLDLSKVGLANIKKNSAVNIQSGSRDIFDEMYEKPSNLPASENVNTKSKVKKTLYVKKWNP